MKKILLLTVIVSVYAFSSTAQKYKADKSSVVFYSHATVEDITARNTESNSIFDLGTGEIAFSIPVKEFKFSKSLMKEHFNEKYMETEKFPTSTFEGTITGYQADGAGVQKAKATGKLTIHGVTKDIDVPGTVEISGENVLIKSKFIVKLEEYNVRRPQLLWKNIAEQVEVTLDFTFIPHEKK